jgi:hypothetical protein
MPSARRNFSVTAVVLSLVVIAFLIWALSRISIVIQTAHYYGEVLPYAELTQRAAAQGQYVYCLIRPEPHLFLNLNVFECYDSIVEADEALAEQRATTPP